MHDHGGFGSGNFLLRRFGTVSSWIIEINNILTPICQRLIPAGERKFVIQTDNSRSHTAKIVLDFLSLKKLDLPRIPHISQT
jgi:hypothetical protein